MLMQSCCAALTLAAYPQTAVQPLHLVDLRTLPKAPLAHFRYKAYFMSHMVDVCRAACPFFEVCESLLCLASSRQMKYCCHMSPESSDTIRACRHDFVVVETIEFDEDEDDELPMLLTQRDVVLMNKAGPLEEEDQEPTAAQLANGHSKEPEMSEEEKAMIAEADAAAAPVTTAADRAADGAAAQVPTQQAQQAAAAPAPQVETIRPYNPTLASCHSPNQLHCCCSAAKHASYCKLPARFHCCICTLIAMVDLSHTLQLFC